MERLNQKFITFEGPDGAGKTTVLEQIKKQLPKEIVENILFTREPGGSEISEIIRRIILNPQYEKLTPRTEALLYAASRSQHLDEVIIPALKAGQIVFCDRFVDSSIVYQGVGRGLGIKEISEINNFATAGITPKMTIFLDVSPQIGLARIKKSRGQGDRLEREELAFHQKVYDGYLKMWQQNSKRVKRVDASQKMSQVVDDCIRIIKESLPEDFVKE